MYRIDVYIPKSKGNKKCATHWYPSLELAEIARNAIRSLPPKGQHFLVNKRHPYYTVTEPVEDDKY